MPVYTPNVMLLQIQPFRASKLLVLVLVREAKAPLAQPSTGKIADLSIGLPDTLAYYSPEADLGFGFDGLEIISSEFRVKGTRFGLRPLAAKDMMREACMATSES